MGTVDNGGAPATTGGSMSGGATRPAGDAGNIIWDGPARLSEIESTEVRVGFIFDTSALGFMSSALPVVGSII